MLIETDNELLQTRLLLLEQSDLLGRSCCRFSFAILVQSHDHYDE
jgi:hypothetical protein